MKTSPAFPSRAARLPAPRRLCLSAAVFCALACLASCGSGSGEDARPSAAPPVSGAPVPPLPAPGITVLAGVSGGPGNADGAVGRLQEPTALAIDRDRVLYIGDFGATVRRAVPDGAGAMTLATRWRGSEAPRALAADGMGNLVGIIGNRIVRIAPDGAQTTLAGSDEAGQVDGVGAAARFMWPTALAIDGAGLIHVADDTAIRTVSAGGEVATQRAATAALFDVQGELYGKPYGVWRTPTGLAFDQHGNLVIGVAGAAARKVTPAGVRQDTALSAGSAVAADRAGNLYGWTECALHKLDASGRAGIVAGAPERRGAADGPGTGASFGNAFGCTASIAADGAGNVYVADRANGTLRKVSPGAPVATVATVAGKAAVRGLADGAGDAARLNQNAYDLTYDGSDNLYFVQDNKVRKVTRAGLVSTLNLPEKDAAQNPIAYFTGGMAYGGTVVGVANRVLYVVEPQGTLRLLAGSPTAPRQADGVGAGAGFGGICDVTRDGAGNLYLIDCHAEGAAPDRLPDHLEHRIRKVTPAGVVTTLYAPQPDDGTRQPYRIAADRHGNVFASTNDGAVVRIAAGGAVASIALERRYGGELTLDGAGNLFMAPLSALPAIIEKMAPGGRPHIVAGNIDQFGLIAGTLPGSLNLLSGVAVDERGVIYALSENAVVRIVPR